MVPAGSFVMGSLPSEAGSRDAERPQHTITIAKPLAVSEYELTFDEWDACVAYGDCDPRVGDAGWGRGQRPVIYVSWDDAKQYVAWLANVTGKPYRLVTEAEYEYATRAGTTTAYPWGNDIGENKANCDCCGSHWDNEQTAPVGSFDPPTSSVCMTWWGMSGSGPRIASTATMTAPRPMVRRGSRAATAIPVSSAALPGTTLRTTSAPRTASRDPRITGATFRASELRGRFPLEPPGPQQRRVCAKDPGCSCKHGRGPEGGRYRGGAGLGRYTGADRRCRFFQR